MITLTVMTYVFSNRTFLLKESWGIGQSCKWKMCFKLTPIHLLPSLHGGINIKQPNYQKSKNASNSFSASPNTCLNFQVSEFNFRALAIFLIAAYWITEGILLLEFYDLTTLDGLLCISCLAVTYYFDMDTSSKMGINSVSLKELWWTTV
jgi:hypothetical protein